MTEPTFIHDIHYTDSCLELLCFTDKGFKILSIYDFNLYFYVEYDPEIEGFLIRKYGRGMIETVARRKMFGYHPEPTLLIKVMSPSQKKLYFARAALRREFPPDRLKIWEDTVDPVLRFIQVTGKTIGKWYHWPRSVTPTMRDVDRAILADISEGEMFMSYPNHLITASFDIETAGLSPSTKMVHTIGLVIQNGDGTYKRNICLHLHQVDPTGYGEQTTTEFVACTSETDLLMTFQRVMQQECVSVILGFNTSGFDLDFIFERARILGVHDEFYKLSWWYPEEKAELVEARLRGYKNRKTTKVPGVHSIDLLILAKEQMKLDSYNLNAVAADALGDGAPNNQKHKVELADMLSCGEETCSPQIRYTVGEYCIQDCDLVFRISNMRDYVNLAYQSASRGFVTPFVSMYNGITRKINSLFMHHANAKNFVFNSSFDLELEEEEDKYKGGFVVDPRPGCHGPVIILDFASLYPSQVLQYTLCPTQELTPEQAAAMPPEMVRRICLDEENTDNPKYHYLRIAQSIDETIVPFIEEGLYADRAFWKKKMKLYEPGSPGYKCANANQLSVKVLMNAIYGAMALISRKIAECITACGRQTIKESIRQVIEHFGATLIYGDTDSMMITLPEITSIETEEEKRRAFDKAREIADFVTNLWLERSVPRREKPIVVLEPEAVVYGFWQKKKMYALKKWEGPTQIKPKFTTKGLTPGRRDCPTFVRQAVSQFLEALVNRDFDLCQRLVKGVIGFIQEKCFTPPTDPKTLQDFSLSCSFGKEEYDNPTGAIIVVNRRRAREFDKERFTVSAGFEIGDRVPFVVISPETREVLRFHILKLKNLPVGAKVCIDGLPCNIPEEGEDGWQTLYLKKKIVFRPDPKSSEHRRTAITITDLDPVLGIDFKPEFAFLDGVGAFSASFQNSVQTGKPQMQIIFRVTEGSMALRAEDIPFVDPEKGHLLDYTYYLRRFTSPIEAAIEALTDAGMMNAEMKSVYRLCQHAATYRGPNNSVKRQSDIGSFYGSSSSKKSRK